jgi:anthranilate/para-aminobenzoate synthase component I/branched-subunit amino acid aminotransferase/4-amino-4-deoxychorismate lyase
VRLVRVPLRSELGPLEVLRALRGRDRPFALVGSWAGGEALLGCDPLVLAAPTQDPFALLDLQPEVSDAVPGAVGGGWVGYLGYSLGRRLERLPPPPPRRSPLPPFALAFYDHLLRRDGDGQWWFEALWEPARERRLGERLDALRLAISAGRPALRPRPYSLGRFAPFPGRRAHARAVDWCRAYIAAGDLYQANLCLRLEASFGGDPLDLFAGAAGALAPDRGAYLAGPWGALASLSPELFLRRSGRSVLSAPIKGTRPAGDAAERARLLASEKDRAENVMIVDLMRNDLGKSCEFGSVHVPALARAVPGPGVWHLVSEVAGTLAPGASDGDLVRGSFPPGSVTGAPKIKAMEVISELESSAREAYTGAIGFASPVAGLELNVAIRTFEFAEERVWVGAGGGITWGSDPDAEYRECLTKARPLIAAAGGRIAPADDRAAAAPLPAAPSRRPRPDPERGVLETMLALDGEVLLLKEHLGRLEASAQVLYDQRLPSTLQIRVPDAGPCRLRVVARRGAGGIADVQVERIQVAAEAMFPARPLELRPLVLPGGLGSHKWADRRLVGGPAAEPLIVDLGGELLETGSGNLFAVERDTVVTPPPDGRILPGVTRAAAVRIARELGLVVAVEPLDMDRARDADELFVTSAVRGVQPVARCTGVGEWPVGDVALALAGRLRLEWAVPAPAPR